LITKGLIQYDLVVIKINFLNYIKLISVILISISSLPTEINLTSYLEKLRLIIIQTNFNILRQIYTTNLVFH